jgi:LacI family transcriptional regulator, repressor for deo operon, udp, cdd, tsx, nupC, and nupG
MDAPELSALGRGTPIVLLGEKIDRAPIDHVAFDNVAAACMATEHLLSLGRRRIAAIGFQAEAEALSGVAKVRRAGYEQALRAFRLAVDPALTREVHCCRRSEGAAAMLSLLSESPDAVLCFNDLLALGALHLLNRQGVRVPEDVAVVGVGDLEDGRCSTPTLTTMALIRPPSPGKRCYHFTSGSSIAMGRGVRPSFGVTCCSGSRRLDEACPCSRACLRRRWCRGWPYSRGRR